MKAPASHSTSLADFWDDGPTSPAEKKENQDYNSNSSANVTDLLNFISNVTIKRRKFRRRSRCSNLLAEATLSSTLRQARHELAVKQEEKRRKAQEFSYQLSIKVTQVNEYESQVESRNNYYNSQQNTYVSSSPSLQEIETENCRKDEHVQACISSLDNFFSELKSIKV